MLFIDEARIFVRSGKGGDGAVTFRREKYIPKGGPDGGDGGRGGDVVLVADPSMSTLLPLAARPHIRAEHGEAGRGRQQHGADGKITLVNVPIGTTVYDDATGERVADLDEPAARVVVAEGGRGGFGNEHFKSATNQTPREYTPGEPFVERTLRLELKLLADVGLVGKPNAGKSTFLRAISRATPKVADYPFTTLEPCLGIAELDAERRLVVADLPGLIEGAAEGAGLGHEFLRHIERTGVLLHLIEATPADDSDPVDNYHTIRRELSRYSQALAAKRELAVISKIDLVAEDARDDLVNDIGGRLELNNRDDVYVISAATGEGVPALLEACWAACRKPAAPGWAEAGLRKQ
jgi:GTP-binding protein